MFSPSGRAKTVAIAVLCGVAAFAMAADPLTPPTVTSENAFTFYRPFTRLTRAPLDVSMRIAVMCAAPSPEQKAFDDTHEKSPHANARVHLYVNPAAGDVVNKRQTAFPPGAVVIKEKLATDDSPSAVGGMIKHAPGYDPEHGDWEYFYCEKGGAPTSGRLANCVTCHAGARATDYVFSIWSLANADAAGPH